MQVSLRFCLLAFASAAFFGCGQKLGVRFDDPLAELHFLGISNFEQSLDGDFIVQFDQPVLKGTIVENVSFDLFRSAIAAEDEINYFDPDAQPQFEQDTFYGSLIRPSDDLAPAQTGIIVKDNGRDGLFRLTSSDLQSGKAYALQAVVREGAKGRRVGASAVFVHMKGLEFQGLKSLTQTEPGKSAELKWDPPADTSPGSNTTYYIYKGKTFDELLGVTLDTHYTADLLSFNEGDVVYFGVRAGDQRGLLDANTVTKKLTVGAPGLTFPGLKVDHVILASDLSKISLTWDKATHSQGTVRYAILNYGDVVATVVATNYEIINPKRHSTYALSVKAKDDNGDDTNLAPPFVVISVP